MCGADFAMQAPERQGRSRDALISALMPLFERERRLGQPMALAVVLETEGSTYSKRGAPLLISRSGEYAGLLSGGCLEGDLCAHALEVIGSGVARQVRYDSRGPDELLFGLGAGCEGALTIFVMRVGPDEDWQPLAHYRDSLGAGHRTAAGLVVEGSGDACHAGSALLPGAAGKFEALLAAAARSGQPTWSPAPSTPRVLALPLVLPARLLLLGAGQDAQPLAALAAQLGWRVAVHDHRPAFAVASRFPAADIVTLGRPEALAATLDLEAYDAVVVMSHHLESDAAYLRALAASQVPFVGLLGPAPRREKLRQRLGADFTALAGRLRSPVGLALGGRASTSVALGIVAEVHAWLHGGVAEPLARGRTCRP